MNTSFPLVVIGGSAGAIEALKVLVKDLPADLNAAVFVVVHLYSQSKGLLPSILQNAGNLPAAHPKDGELYQSGQIYVAPPDYHIFIENGYIRLSHGPKENRHRPAIDPLFRSAARHRNSEVIAVLLTGMLDDGTAGLMAVQMRNGKIIVQSPESAMHPDMPQNAIDHVEIDYILPLDEIAAQIVKLVSNFETHSMSESSVIEELPGNKATMDDLDNDMEGTGNPNRLIPMVCPDCGGTLWESDEAGMLHYRCHVGHAFTARSLFDAQSEAVEEALWTAVRALKEKSALARQLAQRLRESGGDKKRVEEYEIQAAHAEHQWEVIRKNLLDTIIDPRLTPNSGTSPFD